MNITTRQTDFMIANARIVTPERILEPGSLRIESGVIADFWQGNPGGCKLVTKNCFDAGGALLLPGFVDLHADSLETAIAPRPAAPFDPAAVLPTYDAELALHGITTVFHCVGLADLEDLAKPLRTRGQAARIVQAIRDFIPAAALQTHIHLRYEITDTDYLPMLHQMIEDETVDLVSLMDHTPGFGVFKDLAAYREYYHRSGLSIEAADERFAELTERRQRVDEATLRDLVRACHQHDVTVVSHDDHTAAKLQWALDLGVSIAEFPVTLEAVDFARSHGMATVFGTPNLIRGASHAGNLKVAEMLAAGQVDILCLDYSPRCSLPAFFKAAEITNAPLPQVTQLFSLNPARSVGLEHVTGSIEIGKQADLILVDQRSSHPKVLATFVGGRPVYYTMG